jgi:hypothetical protein
MVNIQTEQLHPLPMFAHILFSQTSFKKASFRSSDVSSPPENLGRKRLNRGFSLNPTLSEAWRQVLHLVR